MAVLLTFVIGAALVGVVHLFAPTILSWFVADPVTQAIAARALLITLWSYVLVGIGCVLAGVIRSTGTVGWPSGLSIAAVWLVQLPVAYLFVPPDRARRDLERLPGWVRDRASRAMDLLRRDLAPAAAPATGVTTLIHGIRTRSLVSICGPSPSGRHPTPIATACLPTSAAGPWRFRFNRGRCGAGGTPRS
jgi:MatE